ncbi:acyl-CoA dehydrogenase family protein [Paenibacillus sp. FSL P2-0136]|uniref:acyl-CoA dehydrogenase family protein n=1 Tax=Paenibacillus sp. FSL P2-0136 TaxID=2975317 RepID=UPI0030D8365D
MGSETSIISKETFRLNVQDFIQQHVLPHFEKWENDKTISVEFFKKASEYGLIGINVPQSAYGSGLDFSYTKIMADEFMRARAIGPGSSLIIQSNTVCPLLYNYGSDYIRHTFLKPLIEGNAIASFAATDPSGGSDLIHSIETSAVKVGDEWVISGEKMFITNSTIADYLVVLARTTPTHNPLSMTMFLVPTDSEGVIIEEMEKSGQLSSPIGRIYLNQCRVPESHIIGKVGRGFLIASESLVYERILIGAGSITFAQACLEKTIEFLKDRTYKDMSITSYQSIRHELSTLYARLKSYESFVNSVIQSIVEGKLDKGKACISKFALCDFAQKVIKRCCQLHGSTGLYEDSWISKAAMDSRVFSIYAGSTEMLKELYSLKYLSKFQV